MLYINSNGFLVFHIQSLAALNVTPVATSTATPSPIAPNKTSDIVGPQLPLNAWTHIAASYDPNAGLMKLYLNGTLAASMWVTGTVTYNTSYGITLSDPTNPFYGMMDEVSIYGTALSDFQIQSLSNLVLTVTPNPTYTPTSTPPPTSTLTPTMTSIPLGSGIYDDTDPGWTYAGSWSVYSGACPYNSTDHYTTTVGDTASFTFSGTTFIFKYVQDSNCGNIGIYVDGSLVTTLNANGALAWAANLH